MTWAAYRDAPSRAAILGLTMLAALAALFVFQAAPGQAASSYTVTFGSTGADGPRDLSVNEGDVVIFQNGLSLTGAITPVQVRLGTEDFTLMSTPVTRTISASVTYSGTYTILGIPAAPAGGTITVAAAPLPAPPPAPPGPPPAPPSPADPGPPATIPPAATTATAGMPGGDNASGASALRRGQAAPSHVVGGAGGAFSAALGGTASVQVPRSVVGSPSAAAASQPPSSTHRLASNNSDASTRPGFIALIGAMLLIGVGIALARTLLSEHFDFATY